MWFEVLGEITDTETIAAGDSVRERGRLKRMYGPGRWRKRKGAAVIRLEDGSVVAAEVHWYEAHGVGRREIKVKQFLPPRS